LELLGRLRAHYASLGIDAYLLGGFIRDTLLHRVSYDIDLAVSGDAKEQAHGIALAMGGTFVPLDHERGIYRVAAITPDDGRWTVDIATLQGTIDDDLRRRDFTVDALAVPLADTGVPYGDWPIIDPTGGLNDLASKTLRLTGPDVLAADPLRLIRAVRIAVQTGFDIEPETADAVREQVSLISTVSAERVREELLTILSLPGVWRSVELLDTLGLMDEILPELTPARGVEQPKEHHWDVFEHSLHCTEFAEQVLDPEFRRTNPAGKLIPWSSWLTEYFDEEYADGHTRATYLKLAALLHDVAKPETKALQPDGRVRFLGHPVKGAATTKKILKRLRASSKASEAVRVMVDQHLRPSQLAQKGEMPTSRAVYRYYRDVGDVAVDTLYLCMADYLAARGPDIDLEDWGRHCERMGFTLQEKHVQEAPERRQRLLTGHDLMALFNLSPGPELQPLLEMIQEAHAAGEANTKEEALTMVSQALGKEPVTSPITSEVQHV
jgi:poly(A) polymerase